MKAVYCSQSPYWGFSNCLGPWLYLLYCRWLLEWSSLETPATPREFAWNFLEFFQYVCDKLVCFEFTFTPQIPNLHWCLGRNCFILVCSILPSVWKLRGCWKAFCSSLTGWLPTSWCHWPHLTSHHFLLIHYGEITDRCAPRTLAHI